MQLEVRQKEAAKTSLGSIKPGDVFHFADITIGQAYSDDAVYIVLSGGKDGRIQIANVKDGLVLLRDDEHKVIKLNMTMVLNS